MHIAESKAPINNLGPVDQHLYHAMQTSRTRQYGKLPRTCNVAVELSIEHAVL